MEYQFRSPLFHNFSVMKSFLLIMLLFGCCMLDAQLITHFDFNEIENINSTFEKITQTKIDINNHFGRPERIKALDGQALRLDGWSTYLRTSNLELSSITNALTIETWYATEAFTQKSSSILDYSSGTNELYLAINPVGNVIFNLKIDGQVQFVVSSTTLDPYQWHHIVATVDPITKTLNIYIDGQLNASKELTQINSIQVLPTTAFVGKRNADQSFSGFSLNTLNGAIDDLKIYNIALTKEVIFSTYNIYGPNYDVDLWIDHNVRHISDHLRPRYHVMPNTFWANETYGLIYFKDKYHMFFQKNPNGPYLYYMHWGHFSSPDLVTWKEEKIALRPTLGFSSFGVWSGTTVLNNLGVPTIAYTGVDGSKAGIGIATPLDDDLIAWDKKPNNAIIPSPPQDIPNNDFRDPYIWKEGDTYWMIVGSGLKNNGGGILFTYTSVDLVKWTNVPPLYKSSSLNTSGTFWEMPFFNKITDEDYMLTVTPVFNGKPADCIYWIGSFKNGTFTPYDSTPKSFELFSEKLLAPSFQKDTNGNWTYIGIIPEDRSQADQVAAGWRQTFSVPRVIRLLDDKKTIAHAPHPNLCRIRKNEVLVQNRKISPNTNFNIPEYRGNQSELIFKIYAKNANQIYLQVYKNDAGTEMTTLILDKSLQKISMNRFLSSPYNTAKDIRTQSYTFRPDDTINVRMYLDRSTLEVFVDDLVVISSRVYPSSASNNIDIISPNKEIELVSLNAWDIGDKENLYPDITCPTYHLPDRLNSGLSGPFNAESVSVIYPNPSTQGEFYIKLPLGLDHSSINLLLFDLHGHPIDGYQTTIFGDSIKLELSRENQGNLFIGRLQIGNEISTLKFIKN